MNITVVIPVYKKVNEFIKNLKQNIVFLKGCEIIIVNDDPSESIATSLSEFKDIILIENKKNLGFGPTVNVGVKESTHPYILLLNSDVVLENDSYKDALTHFTDKTIFAVSFAQKEKNGEIVGKNKMFWNKGFLQHSKANDLTFGINGWAEGGSCLIDSNKFKNLNGFDPLYSPFYWEDIDLSYRAWLHGYQVLFDPSVVVQHHHESTIGSFFKKKTVEQIAFRNQLLCIWKNISNPLLLISHIFYLKLFILKSLLKGDLTFIQSYFKAVGKLPTVLKNKNNTHSIRTDNEIFSKFLQ